MSVLFIFVLASMQCKDGEMTPGFMQEHGPELQGMEMNVLYMRGATFYTG